MATTLAIITVLSGVASIAGLIVAWKGKTEKVRRSIKVLFGAAILFSVYMLFIPGSAPVENVESKIRYYSKQQDSDTLIQEGTFSFGGQGPYAIQYPIPYAKTPIVRVVNINGYVGPDVPSVSRTTNHFFELKRHGSTAAIRSPLPHFLQGYKWVSEGKPFMLARHTPQ